MTVQCFWWASLCIDIHLSPQTNCNSNIGITFELQVRNRLATFKNWPFSEEEGSDCTPARFNQSCALSAEWNGVYQGWQRQASMPVEEIMNLIWRAATSAGLAPANILRLLFLALAIHWRLIPQERAWWVGSWGWPLGWACVPCKGWSLAALFFTLTFLFLRGNVPLSTWERKQVNWQ